MKIWGQTINRLKPKGEFARNVLILMTGTSIAQALPIIISPVLTRIYTPEDFGIFAVFVALIASISPCVTGKYEVAMVLPRFNNMEGELLVVGIWVGVVISTLIFVVVLFFQEQIINLLNTPSLNGWILLMPFVLLLTGLMNILSYLANRHKQYRFIASSKVLQSVIIVSVNVALGFLGVGFVGLLIGNILGVLSAFIYFIYKQQLILAKIRLKWSKRKAALARRYIDYPIYNASTGLLNGITSSMPIFFLAYYFPESIVGYFALMVRVASAPLSLVSEAVSQVNLKKIVDLVNNKKDVRPYLVKVTASLMAIILLPTIILTIFSPEIFLFIFGEEWEVAGIYMQILMPAIAVKFVVSTLSTTLGATQHNRLGAIWKFTSIIVAVAVFMIYAPQGNILLLLKAVLVMDIALYVMYYLVIWYAAANPRKNGVR